MDAQLWRRLWEVFEGALERPEHGRAGYLDAACAGDLDLRRQVESLLSSDARAGVFIEEALAAAAKDLTRETPPVLPEPAIPAGTRLGAFEIVREISRGGMGTVFLAARADDQYRQLAAIKIVRGGVENPDLLRRFRTERQILAGLDHPNIARLLDGGATEDGLPYVVMEYVDGEPIDVYCDQRGLGIDKRIRLFRILCGAVHYAHRNLVVHRDIKPGNVIVTSDGTPKLLDFGIAKLLETPASTDAPQLTRAPLRLLTPEYASPEQVRGEAVSTSSDVYSLGALLYLLLTGRLPHEIRTLHPREIEKAVCDTTPAAPSAVIRRVAPASTASGTGDVVSRPGDPVAAAGARSTTPERLARRLAGDLDNIVMKALRKEPERRYMSVDQLSEDLRRHLEGLPVLARKDTLRYRTGKFVRRHPIGVAAAAAVLIVVTAFTLSLRRQSAVAARERDRAVAAERLSQREADTARQVSDFIVEIFKVSDPSRSRGRQIPAREILDAGARRVRAELAGQPEVRARLMLTIGEVYANLGLDDEALALIEESVALRRSLHGEEHPEVAQSLAALGALHLSMGDASKAETSIVAALDMRRRLLGPSHADIVESLGSIGRLRAAQGRLGESETAHREALRMARVVHGTRSEAAARALHDLGEVLRDAGRYAAAEPLLRNALEMRVEILGEDHPGVASTMNALGTLLRLTARYADAEVMLRRYLELTRRNHGPESVNAAVALNQLSALLKEKGDLVPAEAMQREALSLVRRAYGEVHPLVGLCLNNLANLRHDRGDYREAEALHRQSLALSRKLYGERHPRVGDDLNNLANLLWDEGRFDAAEPLYREALSIDRELLGNEHPYVAMDLNNLALVLRDRGDLKGAEPLVLEAIAVSRKAEGDDSPTTALYVGSLGMLRLRMGRHEEAERFVRESLRVQEAGLPRGNWRIHQTRAFLAEVLVAARREAEAEPILLDSVAALEKTLGVKSGVTRRAREALATLYHKTGREAEAARYAISR